MQFSYRKQSPGAAVVLAAIVLFAAMFVGIVAIALVVPFLFGGAGRVAGAVKK